jgi:2-iminoacetate synthase ThiH
MRLFSVVHIETQNLCTRKCWYCKFGQERRDPSVTRLPDALIEKIADNLKDLDYRGRISPFGINEPLMDPRMLDIIRLFRAKCPRAFISIYFLQQWGFADARAVSISDGGRVGRPRVVGL